MTGGRDERSGRPRPARGEVHVWRARIDAGDWPPADGLPEEERRRAERYLSGAAARRWVASRWALRRVLGRYLGLPAARVRLRTTERGKPELADPGSGLRFNLSHSDRVALVAVADSLEVGVDVEELDERRDPVRLARHGLEPADAEAVLAARPSERQREFLRRWTRREAIGKCLGTGLAAGAASEPVAVVELDAGPGRAAALAVAGDEAPRVRVFELRPGAPESADPRTHSVNS